MAEKTDKCIEFKGLDDWFEVFPAGIHTDSAGNKKEWTESDLDQIMNATLASKHEAPLVVGHPRDNAPAYGWLAGIKSEGGKLYAKAKDVMQEFNDMVKSRRFPKRSISLYPDFSIRHIGFLGAVPPAIKGMPDVQFTENDESVTIEFSEVSPWTLQSIASVFRRLREWFIETDSVDKADQIVPEYMIQDIEKTATAPEADSIYAEKVTKEEHMIPETQKAPPKQFSEADVEQIKNEALATGIKQGKDTAAAEFAEQQKEAHAKLRKQEITSFCEAQLKDGKLIPAWIKLGLSEFMNSLDAETVIEFAEGEAGKKSQLDFMKAFLAEIPKVASFSEIATRGKDLGAGGTTAGEKLAIIVNKKMIDNKELTYSAAFAEAQLENADLAAEYQAEISGGK
jgi:hypothetical protein